MSYPIAKHMIHEMPLKPGWNKHMFRIHHEFSNDEDFARLIDYILDLPDAVYLDSGSSRTVFVVEYMGRKTVLKVAHNEKGLAQNKIESELCFDNHYFDTLELTVPGIDYDTENQMPVWLHVEYAQPLLEYQMIRACGGTCADLVRYAETHAPVPSIYREPAKAFGVGEDDEPPSDENPRKINPKAPLTKAFLDFAENWPDILIDYKSINNWGWYEGRPVIVDVGFSFDVGRKHYWNVANRKLYYKGRTIPAPSFRSDIPNPEDKGF